MEEPLLTRGEETRGLLGTGKDWKKEENLKHETRG